jgi:AcrR family transcriptional regulator
MDIVSHETMDVNLSHTRDQLIDAAYAVFEREGVAEGTMTAIAEQAGVGRATLYRHYPGKDVLVVALVLREAQRLFVVLDTELGADEDPASLLRRGLLTALRHLRSHSLLRRTLREEPEAILPFLTVRAAPLLEAAVEFASPYIERAVKAERLPPTHPRLAAEWAARVLLSLLLTPSVVLDLEDEAQLEMFVTSLIHGVFRPGGNA